MPTILLLPPPDSKTFLRPCVWDFFLGLFIQRKVHGQKLQGLIHLIDLKHFCLDQSCHLVYTVLLFKKLPGADT